MREHHQRSGRTQQFGRSTHAAEAALVRDHASPGRRSSR
jgi:hypothetical protein